MSTPLLHTATPHKDHPQLPSNPPPAHAPQVVLGAAAIALCPVDSENSAQHKAAWHRDSCSLHPILPNRTAQVQTPADAPATTKAMQDKSDSRPPRDHPH